jgi:hypothetical protein
MKKIISVLLTILVFSALLFGAESAIQPRALQKSNITSDIWINVNRMNGVFRNNGTWLYDNVVGDWGLEWPRGSGLSPIFAGGQYVACKIDGVVRVAGVQHSATEFQPGAVLAPGVGDNPRDGKYKWYELRPGGVGDWTNWPVDQGAPVDAEGNPMLVGDQTAFSVWNDYAEHGEYGTEKIGVEVQQTVWAFNRADALGDMIFVKFRIVNKGGEIMEDTYLALWQDPDLGNAGDDLVGCDTTLGLGFCYNATNSDQNYGTAPPATGMDFFQGPLINEVGSTVVLPDGTVYPDKRMLRMTSFIYYNNDDSNQGNPQSGQDCYNYFSGLWRDGTPITDDGLNGTTPGYPPVKFMFYGDPETQSGWLDSNPADRRFLMCTGPFTMDAWVDENGNGLADLGEPGVSDIVAGVIVARGADNNNSVTVLKQVDALAQLAYELNFVLAKAPSVPQVTVSERPNEVILTWNESSEFNDDGSPYESADPIVSQAYGDSVIIDNTEVVIDDSTYNFYGYTVWQYADAGGRNPVKVDGWNIGTVHDAEPYTKQRFIRLQTNKHSEVGNVGDPLVNGKEYYFGVTAEAYCKFGAPSFFTSSPQIVVAIPHSTLGERYHGAYGDSLEVTHTVSDASRSLSDGSVVALVIDPSKVTGKTYEVTFNEDLTWNLVTSDGDTVVSHEANQTGNDAYNVYDGLLVKVSGPDPGINLNIEGPYGVYPGHMGYAVTGGTRWVSWPTNWGMETMGGSFGNGFSFFGSDVGAADYVDTEIRFAGVSWPQPDSTAAALMAVSKAAYPERWQKAVVYWRPGYDVQSTLGDVPFTVWDIENNRQLKVAFVEEPRPDRDGAANLIWDMGWGDDNAFGAYGGREYLFIINEDYDELYTDYLDYTKDGTYNGVMYAGGWGSRGYPYLYSAFELTFFASNINSQFDVFSFTAPEPPTPSENTLKEDLDNIRVVPNPYYGYHSGEMNIFERWVQFTNLPHECTIRIFDLVGNQVRKLEKNDETTLLRWDLSNEYELPVASGIYIFHVDAPNIGEKIGKIAIFTPNERLDTY